MADINPKPKIIYPSSVTAPDSQTTLLFARSPRKVPAWVEEAVRHDNRASSGVQETVCERTDKFLEFEVEYMDLADVPAWQAFVKSALQGIPFDYYPDAAAGSFTTFFLDDQKSSAPYKSPGQYSAKYRFYEYVAWQ